MTVTGFDAFLHAPKRLQIMAVLDKATHASFVFFKEYLGVSDSDLSKQMAALETRGYLTAHKAGRGRRAATHYAVTAEGRRALAAHVAALQAMMAADVEVPTPAALDGA